MKVVINQCIGGFSLSPKGIKFLGLSWDEYGFYNNRPRTDPKLVECVETLGEEADGEYAVLKVVEIPDGIEFTIEESQGVEWIAEKHRTWGK